MAIDTVDAVNKATSEALAGLSLDNCPLCQKNHHVPIGIIKHGSEIRSSLADLVCRMTQKHHPEVAVIFDRKLDELVRDMVLPEIQGQCEVKEYALGIEGVWLDSAVEVLEPVLKEINPLPDVIVGIGSGVICDSSKWLATRLERPFAICGTALTMNGYTSITATISENGVKKSVLLNPAGIVVMDNDLSLTAPLQMTQAGLGDLAARSICNADWRLSNLLRGTYFCELPFTMLVDDYRCCLQAATGLYSNDSLAGDQLAEGLLKSGLTMTILGGESSPSSGCEHVLSHFWDWQAQVLRLPHNLHGYQVGIATLIAHSLYEMILTQRVNRLDPDKVIEHRISLDAILQNIDEKYYENGSEFKQVATKKYLSDDEFKHYIRHTIRHWEQLAAELQRWITPVSEIKAAFTALQMDTSLSAIHRSRQDALDALLLGSRYRARYTVLDLAWDLGIFPEAADEVLVRAGVI